MAPLRLLWTRQAVNDLASAHDWSASERPNAAARVALRIEKSAETLRRHPEAGRPGRVKAARELMVPGTPFLIPYRVGKGSVEILAVIHGARKWPEFL